MKFQVDSKLIEKALDDIQGKGKYGVSNSVLDNCVYISLEGNTLELWNADSTLSLTIDLEVEGEEDGNFVFDARTLLPFVKKFTGTTGFIAEDRLTVSCNNQEVILPRIVAHSNMNAITRIKGMLEHITYEEEPETLFMFGPSKYEAAFTLHADDFKKTMGLCELIKSGVYRLDYAEEGAVISSQTSANNRYQENIPISNAVGDAATVEWSGPLHKFFNGKINVYLKDDFPILLVGEDRKLIRAPHVS
tara:strand:+ start:2354 stop:3097 length:744 start_codon:yes stop_codon:yes gene_type:complete